MTKFTILITDSQDPDGNLAYGLFDTTEEARESFREAALAYFDEPRENYETDEEHAEAVESAAETVDELCEHGYSEDWSVSFLAVAGLEG